ncbi:MAG: hypothetical protein WKG07_01425 [Hymenobacter sp.]
MPTWLRKNLGEIIFFAAFALVMTTSLRLPVLSTMQRGLLATGLWRATPPAVLAGSRKRCRCASPARALTIPTPCRSSRSMATRPTCASFGARWCW